MTPVTVLTGFLGSGKTTLLANWLRSPAFSRTAVIVNEFGDVGLDHHLVAAGEDSIVQLTTGCLCCKARDNLIDTLARLAERRANGAVTHFDRVVIETSGLSDPTGICHALLSSSIQHGEFQLDHIVATVDSTRDVSDLSLYPESLRQLALADRLVVTKTDLSLKPLPAIIAAYRETSESASFFDGAAVRHDPTPIFSGLAYADVDGVVQAARVMNLRDANHPGQHHRIHSVTIHRDKPVSASGLSLFLEALAEHCGEDLLRLKGLVNIAESPGRPAVVHGLQHVLYPIGWLDSWPDADQTTRIVLIGQGLSPSWVSALLGAIEIEVQLAVKAQRPSHCLHSTV